MREIFLVGADAFDQYTLQSLQRSNIRTTYALGIQEVLETIQSVEPDCITHCVWDAFLAKPAPALANDARFQAPIDAALIDALAKDELTVVEMLERLNYKKQRVSHLRWMFFQYASYWKAVLEQMQPDAVVFKPTPHMGFDYVIFALCKHLKIPTLIFERTHIPDRTILVDDWRNMPMPPPHLFAEPAAASPRRFSEKKAPGAPSANYFDQINGERNQLRHRGTGHIYRNLRSYWRYSKRLFFELLDPQVWSKKPVANLNSAYGLEDPAPSRWTDAWRRFHRELQREKACQFYDRHTTPPDSNENFVYFPLHVQPERTTSPRGGCFTGQLAAIDLIVKGLPPGWKLYLKEHPRQLSKTVLRFDVARSIDFYKQLVSYSSEKVRVIAPSEPGPALIERARCIATITGTSGWEAVQKGVPAIVFGYPWYQGCPGIHTVSSAADCERVFKRIDQGETLADIGQVEKYRQWMSEERAFGAYFDDSLEEYSEFSPEQNGIAHAEQIVQAMKALFAEKSAAA